MRAADVAKALRGLPNGDGFLIRCPLPSHGKGRGDRNPSLSIKDGDTVELAVRCFGGCDSLDVLAELRRLGFASDPERHAPRPPRRKRLPDPQKPLPPSPAALTLWCAARADRQLVTAYLRSRRITIAVPPTLRQGTDLIFGRTPVPTLVAAIQAPDRRVVAVQELRLTWGGRKAPIGNARKTTGAITGCAVRLAAADDVLGLAEGVETGLSAMQMTGVPVWCSLGAGNLANVIIPVQVRELHVFADADEPGQRAASRVADRWSGHGLDVKIRTPINAGDWNDLLRLHGAVAA